MSLSLDDDLVDESELLARAHDRVCNRMCGRGDSSVERPLTPVPPRSPTRERTATPPAYSPINSVMRRANFHLNWVHKLERCHSLFCSMKRVSCRYFVRYCYNSDNYVWHWRKFVGATSKEEIGAALMFYENYTEFTILSLLASQFW